MKSIVIKVLDKDGKASIDKDAKVYAGSGGLVLIKATGPDAGLQRWSVTHIGTGLAVRTPIKTKDRALEIMNALTEEMDWSELRNAAGFRSEPFRLRYFEVWHRFLPD